MALLKYKAVLLDLDDTLYAYEPCNTLGREAVVSLCHKETGHDFRAVEDAFASARKQVNQNLCYTAASHNRLLYFHKMTELLEVKDLSLPMRLYTAYWGTFLDAMELRSGVERFLQAIVHVPVCLLTDLTAHIQFRKIERLQLTKYISYMVTSEEVGVEKPDPKGFQLALKKCGVQAAEACMVGDNFTKDIEAAQALGMDAYWYASNAAHNAFEHRFDSFNKLQVMLTQG
eukprot:TRINITY_DN3851_c0_g4_i2.p1 TRINITY_DN3851_c0_g4~~TRINITY_DN3851_c0_g4_i2.p1  ORF type:complete len:230 (+),score=-15.07 TRINITY_DN3851_c0_g4_i2:187-876(+)